MSRLVFISFFLTLGLACELEELLKCVQMGRSLMFCAESLLCASGKMQKVIPSHGIKVIGLRVNQLFSQNFGLFTGCTIDEYHKCFDIQDIEIFECIGTAGCIGLVETVHFNGDVSDLQEESWLNEDLDGQIDSQEIDEQHKYQDDIVQSFNNEHVKNNELRLEVTDSHNEDNDLNSENSQDRSLDTLKTRLKELVVVWNNLQGSEELEKISKELENIEHQMISILRKGQQAGLDTEVSSEVQEAAEIQPKEKNTTKNKESSLFGRVNSNNVKIPDVGNVIYGDPYEFTFKVTENQEKYDSDLQVQTKNNLESIEIHFMALNNSNSKLVKDEEIDQQVKTGASISEQGQSNPNLYPFPPLIEEKIQEKGFFEFDQSQPKNPTHNEPSLNKDYENLDPVKTSESLPQKNPGFLSENESEPGPKQNHANLPEGGIIRVSTFDYMQTSDKDTIKQPTQLNQAYPEPLHTEMNHLAQNSSLSTPELFSHPIQLTTLQVAGNENPDYSPSSQNSNNEKDQTQVMKEPSSDQTKTIETFTPSQEPVPVSQTSIPSLSSLSQKEDLEITKNLQNSNQPNIHQTADTAGPSKETNENLVKSSETPKETNENLVKSSETPKENIEKLLKSSEISQETIENSIKTLEPPKDFLKTQDESLNCSKDCERMCEKRQNAVCLSECMSNFCSSSSSWWSDYYTVILTGVFLFLVVGVIYLFTQNKNMRTLIENGDYGIYSNISN